LCDFVFALFRNFTYDIFIEVKDNGSFYFDSYRSGDQKGKTEITGPPENAVVEDETRRRKVLLLRQGSAASGVDDGPYCAHNTGRKISKEQFGPGLQRMQ